MIAEVELYRGNDPGVMMLKLCGLHCARKNVYADTDILDEANQYMQSPVNFMLRDMYEQNSDTATSPVQTDLRIDARACSDPECAYHIVYEDRMHTAMVNPTLLPEVFKGGLYFCSVTMTVDKNFWFRPQRNNKLCSLINLCKCKLVLNILERTGDVVPRPLTLWEHWKAEFWQTFVDV